MTVTQQFYDGLADLYHFIYEDWPASIERQGAVLDEIIRAASPSAKRIADMACGIVTQALGLAARGYDVQASDISEAALRRASIVTLIDLASRAGFVDLRRIDDKFFQPLIAAKRPAA